MKPSVLKRLERFNKALKILEDVKDKGKDVFISDDFLISVAERNIHVACEFALDLSSFILSEINAGVPETYKDMIKKLNEAKVIDKELEEKMKGIVGLRNIIVHLYADIKYDVIFDSLEEIVSTLKNFVEILLKYCKEKGIDP